MRQRDRCKSVFMMIGILAAMTALLMGASACGGSDVTSAESPTATSGGANALLPENVKSSGILKVGTSFPYAPFEFLMEDGVTPTGLNVELTEAIAKTLGLKVEWVNMNWDGLILALESKRFDVIGASMGDFTDRQEKVNFVDYINIGEALIVKSADAPSLTSPDDLSGKTIGAAKGTVGVSIVRDLSNELEAKGMQPVELKQFDMDADGVTAVQSGRIFGIVVDTGAASYTAETAGGGGVLAMALPNMTGGIPWGYGTRKDDMALATAIQAALKQLKADGTYAAIFDKWGLSESMVDEFTINGGTTSSGV